MESDVDKTRVYTTEGNPVYLNGILIGNIHIGILDHFHDNPEGFENIGGSLLLISCVRLSVCINCYPHLRPLQLHSLKLYIYQL